MLNVIMSVKGKSCSFGLEPKLHHRNVVVRREQVKALAAKSLVVMLSQITESDIKSALNELTIEVNNEENLNVLTSSYLEFATTGHSALVTDVSDKLTMLDDSFDRNDSENQIKHLLDLMTFSSEQPCF